MYLNMMVQVKGIVKKRGTGKDLCESEDVAL